MATPILPLRAPTGLRIVSIIGGENLFRLAELYLGDATQWWRIAAINDFPGEPPDFRLTTADSQRLSGQLQIPQNNPTATWP